MLWQTCLWAFRSYHRWIPLPVDLINLHHDFTNPIANKALNKPSKTLNILGLTTYIQADCESKHSCLIFQPSKEFFKKKNDKKNLLIISKLITSLNCYVKDIFHIFFSEPCQLDEYFNLPGIGSQCELFWFSVTPNDNTTSC